MLSTVLPTLPRAVVPRSPVANTNTNANTNLKLNLHPHSITVAVDVVLAVEVFSSASFFISSSFSFLAFVIADTVKEAAKVSTPTLAPAEVAIVLATVLPATLEMLWKASALDTLVDCHTFASKLDTWPVLRKPADTHTYIVRSLTVLLGRHR